MFFAKIGVRRPFRRGGGGVRIGVRGHLEKLGGVFMSILGKFSSGNQIRGRIWCRKSFLVN